MSDGRFDVMMGFFDDAHDRACDSPYDWAGDLVLSLRDKFEELYGR